jgi:hypothetical protein
MMERWRRGGRFYVLIVRVAIHCYWREATLYARRTLGPWFACDRIAVILSSFASLGLFPVEPSALFKLNAKIRMAESLYIWEGAWF